MSLRFGFVITLCLALSTSLSLSAQEAVPDEAALLVQKLKDSAFELYGPEVKEAQRLDSFCKMVDDHVDVQSIAKSTLGRYARQFPDSLLPGYQSGIKAMMMRILDGAFSKMQGAKVIVQPTSRPQDNGAVVTVTIEHVNRVQQRVQFFLNRDEQAKLRMTDAALNGIRLVWAKRSEFEGIITRSNEASPESGPQVLVNELQQRNGVCL